MQPAADPVLDVKLVFLAGKPQQAEQILPHRPIGIVQLAALGIVHGTARRRALLRHHFDRPRPRQSCLRGDGSGLRRDKLRGHRQLAWVEHSALLLIVRKIRLAEDVAEVAELIGPIEDRPDVAIEPGLVGPVPGEPAVPPLPQRGLVVIIDTLGLVETCSARRIARCRRRTRARTGRAAPRPSSPCRAPPARNAGSRRSPKPDTRRRRSAAWQRSRHTSRGAPSPGRPRCRHTSRHCWHSSRRAVRPGPTSRCPSGHDRRAREAGRNRRPSSRRAYRSRTVSGPAAETSSHSCPRRRDRRRRGACWCGSRFLDRDR